MEQHRRESRGFHQAVAGAERGDAGGLVRKIGVDLEGRERGDARGGQEAGEEHLGDRDDGWSKVLH